MPKRYATCAFCTFAVLLAFAVNTTYAQAWSPQYVSLKPVTGGFTLALNGNPVPLYVSDADHKGVSIALKNLQSDIGKVTGKEPAIISGSRQQYAKNMVIVGTIGKNPLIDQLIGQNKLTVSGITGKWETFLIQAVTNPFPGVDQALIIAGSDKRGTIFGIYDLSSQIGVSPWYWWADVPVKPQKNLYVSPGRHTLGTPAVKYRGIFINDEAPAFSGWAKEKFGGLNHQVYEKVFELILRLKGNYLWPAMWGNAFNDDDKLNPVLADEYGVVMGTSHHEPMDRAQQEWKRYGKGEWNYQSNAKNLQDFWRQGILNMGTKETIVTVGMRGDGDMPMSEGSNIALLEKIVADQRNILSEVTSKKPEETPQLWALYKEVQEYYDKGMRVPDDVTLLLCDDNWGNIRKLPKAGEPARKGGYGIYYHFDYVGGPRNYKWLNTNPIARVWEQMHLAYEYKANQIWIVNVGDLKPMEFPISFFLDYAWNPAKIGHDQLQLYTQAWAAKQFGPKHADKIAEIITKYTKYNGRRKPELLDQNTYSLTNYREFENVVNDYNRLKRQAELLAMNIPAEYKDAYYQLVLHPVQACANLNEMYFAAAKNSFYAQQGRASTNDMAASVEKLYAKDAEISAYYNKELAGGKWNHMMDQTHIGYTYWQQPPVDKMPEVKKIELPEAADMAVAAEGAGNYWPSMTAKGKAVLPQFDPWQKNSHYIDIFNRGKQPFTYQITGVSPWIQLSSLTGTIVKEQRIMVSIDWSKAPKGIVKAPLIVSGAGHSVSVEAVTNNPVLPNSMHGFVPADGYIAMEAAHYTKAVNQGNIKWIELPNHGRMHSGMTVFPVTMDKQQPANNGAHLEYQIVIPEAAIRTISIQAHISPTIDFSSSKGLQYAIAIDDEKPQIINIHANENEKVWEKSVADNIRILSSQHTISNKLTHVIKFWAVSPGVVLQRLVIDLGGLKPSYLGPPESYYSK